MHAPRVATATAEAAAAVDRNSVLWFQKDERVLECS